MQTILGANGVISKNLAQALAGHTSQIRLVSRSPRAVNRGDELFAADLTDAAQTSAAVAGSEIAYLTVGLPYKTAVWQAQWPVVMRNVIDACKQHQVKLVFFDNVYLYGPVSGPMTEETPIRPSSRKGAVRAQIAQMLLDEMRQGNIQALIARAADFYGPDTPLSFVTSTVFVPFSQGKGAMWFVNDQVRHSFTYTPDAGKATALLGNTPSAYGQSWHLPGAPGPLTGREFIAQAAEAFGVPARHQTLAKWMIRMAGLFDPIVRESVEMLYQSEAEYLFDSSKFGRAFPDFQVTSYAAGIRTTAEWYRKAGG
ncbi:MAG: NAD-dependent epimerase/dehydratase family protein [Bacteroidia bacterium]|nr:NAD-dependent epimerase/dehydratase family protein [Bacteroidia bacterium]